MTSPLLINSFVAALGSLGTYWLVHKRHTGAIRASSGLTLAFTGFLYLASYTDPQINILFFGSTFVGMTDHSRMGYKRVLISSQLFLFFYSLISFYLGGLGGGLGASAFLACFMIFTIAKFVKKYSPQVL